MPQSYVIAGVAPARSWWFGEVARWATAGVLPIDFVKCMSVEQARARLASGRAFSVLLADAAVSGLDRDMIDQARTAGAAVFIVDDGRCNRDWSSLGACAVLPEDFDRATLLVALTEHAAMTGDHEVTVVDAGTAVATNLWRGRLVAVTGSGGTGSSTLAIALATGMGSDVRNRGLVGLADFCLDAELAVLHDARDIVPGVQELVEAHRAGTPTSEQVRGMTFAGPQPYRLLLGLRRRRDWAVLRPQSFLAALNSLRRTFTAVVCDIDADLEGDRECGSIEVEERNVMARTVADHADLVVVTGLGGVKGLHSLVRTVGSFVAHGVPQERVVPVINRAPRQARARSELSRAFAELVTRSLPGSEEPTQPVVFIPERRRVDAAFRDTAALPASLVGPITAATNAVMDRLSGNPAGTREHREPERILPGSLGSWDEQEAAG